MRILFDDVADHLLVLDHARGSGPEAVVGTYRLICRTSAAAVGSFYTASEFDITKIEAQPGEISSLGALARRTAIAPGRPYSYSGKALPPTYSTTKLQ